MQLYQIKKDLRHGGREEAILVGQYCEGNVPGPMITDEDSHSARVIFHSDSAHVRSGFRAKYDFIRSKSFGNSEYLMNVDLYSNN